MTTRTVQRILEVTFPPARAALEELADAGILSRKSVEKGTTGYLARAAQPARSSASGHVATLKRKW